MPPAVALASNNFADLKVWKAATAAERAALLEKAAIANNTDIGRDKRDNARNEVRALVTSILVRINGRASSTHFSSFAGELEQALAEPHRFEIFAPDTVNYGMMLTYRQTWTPGEYQVGRLVSSIPLAPRETRKYSSKLTRKTTDSEKRLDDRTSKNQSEATTNNRAESEAIALTRNKFGVENEINIGVDIEVFEAGATNTITMEAEQSSQQTKKALNDAASKTAQELMQQNRLEVQTDRLEEMSTESVSEIGNPNDEITVTYLFYELQRQYEVRQKLRRAMPVVLVAHEVPAPHDIDDDWIIVNAKAVRGALLDESLRPVIDYLVSSMAGDEAAFLHLQNAMRQQEQLVEMLRRKVKQELDAAEFRFNQVYKAIVPRENSVTQFNDGQLAG